MGYHGLLSKGCQRCRRRKVKCDQTKPACTRCEKLGVLCPGYRDLLREQFIDESSRVVRKAKARAEPTQVQPKDDTGKVLVYTRPADSMHISTLTENLPGEWFCIFPNSEAGLLQPSLGSPMNVLCVNFFLAHYAPTCPVLSDDSYDWLFKAYWDSGSDLVRLATDAVSMSAVANKFFAPEMAPRSTELYGRALAKLNSALQDPLQARVNLTSWDGFRRWSAHMEGATTLLELRGAAQFDRAAGKQLYVHLRSQIIHNCMVTHATVPDALRATSDSFQPWGHLPFTYDTRPGSLALISFQIVNLRADVNAGTVKDPNEIMKTVLAVEKRLEQWTHHAPQGWTERIPSPSPSPSPDGLPLGFFTDAIGLTSHNTPAHTYASVNIAQIWNNWRVLRIMAHQILLRHALIPLRSLAPIKVATTQEELDHDEKYAKQEGASAETIRQMSSDVLAAAPTIVDTPRAGSLVWPFFIIAQEPLNPFHVRTRAIRIMRHVNDTLGYRIASLMADTAEETLGCDGEGVGDFPVSQTALQSLLLSF
ncbi:hypothetical protein Micbo1qcDRAFT_193451 [Microdochium bolleyi]|uniref:Zn(2)-C6 fungal-type domain-containing protein n=1 Tax=Microdochium bolleyi TaxID=196109 RepID=A0A136JAL3_9PEZI|nr:hypothetical protein Micbo1qcDRAFT_193451 [Microdochium bolleyi]